MHELTGRRRYRVAPHMVRRWWGGWRQDGQMMVLQVEWQRPDPPLPALGIAVFGPDRWWADAAPEDLLIVDPVPVR